MKHAQPEPEPVPRPADGAGTPPGLELRHLRYFAAVADAGTVTRAAERLFIAQPTLSQQIQRLEQVIGTPLLHRGRDGVQLTGAGTMLLDAARDVLSYVKTVPSVAPVRKRHPGRSFRQLARRQADRGVPGTS